MRFVRSVASQLVLRATQLISERPVKICLISAHMFTNSDFESKYSKARKSAAINHVWEKSFCRKKQNYNKHKLATTKTT